MTTGGTASDLIRQIHESFDVALGDGVSLREARVMDRYGDATQRQAARAQDHQGDWRTIPVADLEGHAPFSFLDAPGFAYYLPAYLTYLLGPRGGVHAPALESVLFGLLPRQPARFAAITAAQARVICRCLEFLEAADPDADCLADTYTEAWTYWAQRS